MEIVIKLPEATYKAVKDIGKFAGWPVDLEATFLDVLFAIGGGQTLPKGHGRLIDAERLIDNLRHHYELFAMAYDSFQEMPIDIKARCDELSNAIADVTNAPTIIEAEGGDAE